MSKLSHVGRQEIVKAAHRQRNREIWKLIEQLASRLMAEPKLRCSRWIAVNRGW